MNLIFRFFKHGTVVNFVDPMGVRPYLGPETLMPLASILAAIAGFFLMFWRLIRKFVRKTYRKMRGFPDEVPPNPDIEDSFEDSEN